MAHTQVLTHSLTLPLYHSLAHQGFGPSVRSLEGLDVEAIPSLQEQPVQSSITLPASSGECC